jgi:hypothetical protein
MTDPSLNERLAEKLGWKRDGRGWLPPAADLPPKGVAYRCPDLLTYAGMGVVLEAMRGRGWYVAIGCAHQDNMQSAFICEGPPAGAEHKDVLLHLHREEEYYHAEKDDPRFKIRKPAFATARTASEAVALAALLALEGEDGTTHGR